MNEDVRARIEARRAARKANAESLLLIRHRDGIDWFYAPVPRRWHRCSPWTWALDGRTIERCACGAIRLDGNGPWMERNGRRRK